MEFFLKFVLSENFEKNRKKFGNVMKFIRKNPEFFLDNFLWSAKPLWKLFLWAIMLAIKFLAAGSFTCSRIRLENKFLSNDSIECLSFTFTSQISIFIVWCSEWMVVE